MPVVRPLCFTLEVPSVDEGVTFYTDARLIADVAKGEGSDVARLRCPGQDRDSIVLLGGLARRRLRHISLRAKQLDDMATLAVDHGGKVVGVPERFEDNGPWVEDPHGMLIHVSEREADPELAASEPFQVTRRG